MIPRDEAVASLWRLFPHTLAQVGSQGKWKGYDYLRFLSTELAQAVCHGNGRFLISIPPRHGKSELISFWLPIWFLNHFPGKRVMLASYEAEIASHWGRRVRNELQFNERVGVPVAQNNSAAHRWRWLPRW